MAGTPVNSGHGDVGFADGTTFATDAVAGVQYPISKIDVGGVGASAPLSAANPMPVSNASLPLPAGASTETTLAAIKAKTDNIDVLLSTRTKPADQQHVVVDSSAIPTGAATEAGNLATIAAKDFATSAKQDTLIAKDFATSAKQDTNLVAINTLDTDLKAEIGVVSASPGAYTVLDRLSQNTQKLDAIMKMVASEATMRKVLAALSKPVASSTSTLLHR